MQCMIDKINGNGNYDISSSNSKNKRKNPAVRAYESTPASKDAAQKRAEELRKKRSASGNQEDAGVILDLSGKTAGKKKEAEAVRRKPASFWTDTLRRLIHPLVRWIKDFWESDRPDPTEAGAQASEMSAASDPEQAADGTLASGDDLPPLDGLGMDDGRVNDERLDDLEAEELKAIADKAVRSGNLRQIEQYVTRNGTKRLAHHSDLLTYYDRRGKFVEIDETEKHRVLFGDKHVLKL